MITQQYKLRLPLALPNIFIALMAVIGLIAVLSLTFAPTASAANGCEDVSLLGMPAWYDGLLQDGDCTSIANPSDYSGGMSGFVWRIVLNVTHALLIIIGYASVIMIITGGFMYMIAAGESGKIVSAKKTIFNAVIGLVIALSAVAIVNLVKGMF